MAAQIERRTIKKDETYYSSPEREPGDKHATPADLIHRKKALSKGIPVSSAFSEPQHNPSVTMDGMAEEFPYYAPTLKERLDKHVADNAELRSGEPHRGPSPITIKERLPEAGRKKGWWTQEAKAQVAKARTEAPNPEDGPAKIADDAHPKREAKAAEHLPKAEQHNDSQTKETAAVAKPTHDERISWVDRAPQKSIVEFLSDDDLKERRAAEAEKDAGSGLTEEDEAQLRELLKKHHTPPEEIEQTIQRTRDSSKKGIEQKVTVTSLLPDLPESTTLTSEQLAAPKLQKIHDVLGSYGISEEKVQDVLNVAQQYIERAERSRAGVIKTSQENISQNATTVVPGSESIRIFNPAGSFDLIMEEWEQKNGNAPTRERIRASEVLEALKEEQLAATPETHKGFIKRMWGKYEKLPWWKKVLVGVALGGAGVGGAAIGGTFGSIIFATSYAGGRLLTFMGAATALKALSPEKIRTSRKGKIAIYTAAGIAAMGLHELMAAPNSSLRLREVISSWFSPPLPETPGMPLPPEITSSPNVPPVPPTPTPLPETPGVPVPPQMTPSPDIPSAPATPTPLPETPRVPTTPDYAPSQEVPQLPVEPDPIPPHTPSTPATPDYAIIPETPHVPVEPESTPLQPTAPEPADYAHIPDQTPEASVTPSVFFGENIVVERGDTLWRILGTQLNHIHGFAEMSQTAQNYAIDTYVKHIAGLAPDRLTSIIPSGDVHLIRPGEVLKLSELFPFGGAERFYDEIIRKIVTRGL